MVPSDDTDELRAALLALLERVAPRPLNIPELARRLELGRYDHRGVARLLDAEVAARKLRRIGKTRYQWLRPADVLAAAARPDGPGHAGPARSSPRRPTGSADAARRTPQRRSAETVEGRYSRARGGYGFVAVAGAASRERQSDVFVPAGNEGDALHGDVVEVHVARHAPRGPRGARGGPPRTTGEVVRVVRRAVQLVIGSLSRGRAPSPWLDGVRRRGVRREAPGPSGWRLIPENDLFPVFEIEGGLAPRDEDEGRLAAARFVQGPSETRGPVAALERILGDADDPEVQFLTIALEHGLRLDFPGDVQGEAERLPLDPAAGDVRGREDLRELPFVTIDGETARDFDDAVCLEALPGGAHRLWVAIADVSHYVRPGTALDAEAVLRGTSVYFPDRAIPMLPERLSNELCSLKPERDRLVMVARIDLDRHGERREARFLRGVIRSRARLTYTQVAAVLSATDTPQIHAWRDELAPVLDQLARMRALMGVLLARRLAAGSLDLDLPEAMIDLSEEGRSVGVRLSQRNDAHRMIEEFMLEANQAVARFLEEHGVPFPYRIHEPPNPTDIDALNLFLGPFGLHVDYERVVAPRDLQSVLRAVAGHPLSRVLSRQVLRALMQARYSTGNAGHFGLAFSTYCHFTSPIRRYPDLLVHRQLGLVLEGAAARAATQGGALEALSLSSSQREREAVAAERAMLDLKKAEFMLEHLLEPEPAMIVGVAAFGFFVELEAYPVEGLVRVEDLPMQTTFDDSTQSLVARRSGESFRLGDRVVVEASNVSLRRRQITFTLLERLARDQSAPKLARRARDAKAAAEPARGRKRLPDEARGLVKLKTKSSKKGKPGMIATKAKSKTKTKKAKARSRANIGKRRKPSS